MEGKRVVIWDVVLQKLATYKEDKDGQMACPLTGIELNAARTIKNLPNPPAGSNAILRRPPIEEAVYASFHAASVTVPVYNAAPRV
jgi:hypothetical protein